MNSVLAISVQSVNKWSIPIHNYDIWIEHNLFRYYKSVSLNLAMSIVISSLPLIIRLYQLINFHTFPFHISTKQEIFLKS